MTLVLDRIDKVFPSRGGVGEVVAVDDVSLTIEEGELVTLLGPSGCGKTTTLRMIAGFEFPTRGEILLDGRNINELPPHQRDMSMVFQSYAIFPHLTVFENVAYGLRVKRKPDREIREQVARVLELVELGGYEKRAPNQLSGGQQQRVALARALIMEPKVLLMDEPLSNLDAKLREQMRTEIRQIQQLLKITSVYVTHDQSEAMTISDRIVVMNEGRIEQVGTPVEIYRHPVNAFVAAFIGRANFLTAEILGVEPGALALDLFGSRLVIPDPRAQARVGEQVTLVLRPEMAELVEDGAHLRGIVRRAAYLGSLVEYDIEVGERLLAVVESDPRHITIHPVGTEVGVRLIESALVVLPKEKGPTPALAADPATPG